MLSSLCSAACAQLVQPLVIHLSSASFALSILISLYFSPSLLFHSIIIRREGIAVARRNAPTASSAEEPPLFFIWGQQDCALHTHSSPFTEPPIQKQRKRRLALFSYNVPLPTGLAYRTKIFSRFKASPATPCQDRQHKPGCASSLISKPCCKVPFGPKIGLRLHVEHCSRFTIQSPI